MAEVIEHLHVAPTLVLRFLHSLLKPGGILVLQTPNALALGHRVKLLLGHHPYEKIREDISRPGHIREHTLMEMRSYGEAAGFKVLRSMHGHHIDLRHKFAVLRTPGRGRPVATRRGLGFLLHDLGFSNHLYRLLPPTLRTGLTLIYQRES